MLRLLRRAVVLVTTLLTVGVAGPAAGQAALPPLPAVAAPGLGTYILDLGGSGTVPAGQSGAGPAVAAAWSPDSSELAVAGSDGAVTIVDAASGTPLAVQQPPGELQVAIDVATHLRWSPDGSRLAYGGGMTIAVVDADGTQESLIVSVPPRPGDASLDQKFDPTAGAPYLDFAWTPDGQALTALQTYRDAQGQWQGQVNDLDPSTGETLADLISGGNAACFDSMSWSPDGAYLALSGPKRQPCPDGSSPNGLWLWAANTSTLRTLHTGGVVAAKWLDAGDLIAEVFQPPANPGTPGQAGRYALDRFQPNQPGSTTLVDGIADPFPAPYETAFDAGGNSVLFAGRDCRANTASAWVVNTNGGRSRQVSDAGSVVYQPRLSPDGTMAAWIRAEADGREIVVAPLSGAAGQVVLSGASGLDNLAWSPDGSKLSFDVTAQQENDCLGP